MDFRSDFHAILRQMHAGKMSGTAYDTAWVARLAGTGEPLGEAALEWLREHQLPDGSWGAGEFYYYHDRLISTLAATVVLARYGDRRDFDRLKRARLGLDIASKGLELDPSGPTIGFEMIAPTLLSEARSLDLLRRQDIGVLNRLLHQNELIKTVHTSEELRRRSGDYLEMLINRRLMKLQQLPDGKINRYITVAFSAEMAGIDRIKLFDIANLQEANGSVANSPSATAYYYLHLAPGDGAALAYLRQLELGDGGGVPTLHPFDVYERAWVLWNLALTGELDAETLALCQPHLDHLQTSWRPGRGIGLAATYPPMDGDDTSRTFGVLHMFGRPVDLEGLLQFEETDYFRCYPMEADSSASVNIHTLEALRRIGYQPDHPRIQKIIRYLRRIRFLDQYWFDKWMVSPYYTTAHTIIAAAGFVDDLVTNAVAWMIETQRQDGAWGYYLPTAEETADCLQALILWRRQGGKVSSQVLKRGLAWLAAHQQPPYPPFWVGKCLYSPELVIRSEILSALMLGVQEGYL